MLHKILVEMTVERYDRSIIDHDDQLLCSCK